MKGISHFVSAVAAASFLPGIVEHSAGGGLLLLLAGVGGLLPDWLDFKWARYFEPADLDLRPDPEDFDARAAAEEIADAIERACDEDDPLSLQLHSLPVGADRWRRYSVRFDSARNRVQVRAGPIINAAGRAVPGTAPADDRPASVPLRPEMRYTYDGEMHVESMEGPSFEFRRVARLAADPEVLRDADPDWVEVSFLPWHRRWTHSLVLAALFGAAAGLAFSGTGYGILAGLALAVGYVTHVLEDQLGHLGSNLWWPFTGRRSAGLKLLHSGDAIPNFATVWTAVGLILFNLNRAAGAGAAPATPPFPPFAFLLWAVLVPVGLMLAVHVHNRRGTSHAAEEGEAEIFDELRETEAV